MSYQMLYDVDRLLTFADIPYWLTAGSLLGAINNGGIIKHDHDVDIGLNKKYKNKLLDLEKPLSKCGYYMEPSKYGYHIRGKKEKPYIDIYLMKETKEEFLPYKKALLENRPSEVWTKEELLPLKRVGFGGFLAFIPKEYNNYLKSSYGRSWKRDIEPTQKPVEIKQRTCLPVFRPQDKGTSPLNKFCKKVFVINLHDYRDRLKKIDTRMRRKGISYTLFDAIDGRCKTDIECDRKRKALQKEYNVKITTHESLPPLSLTLGTWFLLKQQVKNKWERIAIFEDDATFVNNFNKRFDEGVKELRKVAPDWDILYLGCTQFCGTKGISRKQTAVNKHLSSIHKFNEKANFYVRHKEDIRIPCDPEECKTLSKNISVAIEAAGGFGYCISLKGARKILRIMNNKIDDHMDGILPAGVVDGNFYAVSFDPPIVNHLGGADRPDTALEWDWEV
jgi:GR25 family glycosyltransferase involved in LPS biosynthesis